MTRRIPSEPKICCVDLFCGLGGLTHGLIRGGVKVVAGIDRDPECRFAYEANNDAQFIEGDVSKLTARNLKSHWKEGHYTLLAGCAPCQPFSTYSRKGRQCRQDEKWSLVGDFGRLVQESRPDLVTMENVPQLLHHEVFSEFVANLGAYHVCWSVIDCARYGVPQTRKRVVLIASRFGEIKLQPQSTGDQTESPTVRQSIAHLTPLAAGQSDPKDALHSACSLSALNLRRIKASRPGGSWRDWDAALLAACHRKKTGETFPSVYGRMEWDALAPTITTQSFGYGNGRFGHPEQHRAITLREAAVLQTFPDSYQFLPEGVRPRFNVLGRLIGNAVPVRIGEVVAKALRAHLQKQMCGLENNGRPEVASVRS